MTYQEVSLNEVEQEKLHELRQKHLLQFQKEKTALKFYMLGKEYHLGLKALGFLENYSFKNPDGSLKLRKDKKTPEMHHMIRIAFSVTQLRDVKNEELCIILALLHDVQEDEQVQESIIQHIFGSEVATKNWKLTKKFAGQHKNSTEFYSALASDEDASIVKGLDRCDNLENMIGVFGREKIRDYCKEAEEVYLQMLHIAAKLFPEQQHAYYAIRLRMKRAIKAGRDHAFQLECRERQVGLVNSLQQEQDLIEAKLQKSYALTKSGTFEEHEQKVNALVEFLQTDTQERQKIMLNILNAATLNSKISTLGEPAVTISQLKQMLAVALGLQHVTD